MCEWRDPVTVADNRVQLAITEEFAEDPRIEMITIRRPVDVRIPGYVCECGARWYPTDGDTLEDSRRHYESHKKNWCDE